MKKALFFILLLMLPACGHVDVSLSDQIVYKSESPVRKSSLQVSVHPKGKQYRPLTAYFHPFVIQQPNVDYQHLSASFTDIFHMAWMEERLFPIMEVDRKVKFRGVEQGLVRARKRGADLMIIGYVPYFYAGHTVDDTALTIRVDIYSTGSGALLWTMQQSGRIEERTSDDYYYFRHEFRMPTGPFNSIIRSIAKDMAIPLKAWLPSPDAEYTFVSTQEGVAANLTGASPERIRQPDMSKEKNDQGYSAPSEAKSQAARPQINGVNLDIRFDFDKATIKQESFGKLDALGEALNTPELKGKQIIIAGHTDTKGSKEYNLALSQKRAQSVKKYLADKWGINPDTMEAVGYGQSRPLNSGVTPKEQLRNRRVEIRLAE